MIAANKKKFWKTVKPLFSDKISHKDIISLTEDGKTITEDLPIAEIFNIYFSMGAYIKHVGGGGPEGFTNFSKKIS